MKDPVKPTRSTVTGVAKLYAKLRKRRPSIDKEHPPTTKQHFKDECDINNILARYEKTGQLPSLIKENPKYGDFSSPLQYQDSLNLVLHAQTQFEALGSRVRERFSNDPQKFLAFMQDPNNIDEMVQLGLAEKRQQNQTNDEPPADPKQTKKTSKKDPPDEA